MKQILSYQLHVLRYVMYRYMIAELSIISVKLIKNVMADVNLTNRHFKLCSLLSVYVLHVYACLFNIFCLFNPVFVKCRNKKYYYDIGIGLHVQ